MLDMKKSIRFFNKESIYIAYYIETFQIRREVYIWGMKTGLREWKQYSS